MRLRPYKACDANVITRWFKNEYAFRQWSADRYGRFPIVELQEAESYYCMGGEWKCLEMELTRRPQIQ